MLLMMVLCSIAPADDFASLRADHAALERVYYDHRLGGKPPFERVLPPATLENLVRLDLRKEAALQRTYGVEVTPAMLEAEVQRINTTTRAPEMLAEIKAALANDPARFAHTVAKPILVERLLRERFDNDDLLHPVQHRRAEQARSELLAAKQPGGGYDELWRMLQRKHPSEVSETTWQLVARPAGTNASTTDEIEIKKRFGASAQIVSPLHRDGIQRKFYFEDLPGELQKVLQVQLRRPGDVSAVIETAGGFLVYVCRSKSAEALGVGTFSLPKRSYEQWLADQNEGRR